MLRKWRWILGKHLPYENIHSKYKYHWIINYRKDIHLRQIFMADPTNLQELLPEIFKRNFLRLLTNLLAVFEEKLNNDLYTKESN